MTGLHITTGIAECTTAMFERICIPPLRDGRTRYDVGMLAECLLFYGEVVVQMHPASVEGLFRDCPPDVLFELETRGHLRVAYTDSLYATFVHTEPQSDAQFDPCFISREGFALERVAEDALTSVTGRKGRGRRLAHHLVTITQALPYPGEATEAVRRDLCDGTYIEAYIAHVLRAYGLLDVARSPRFRSGNRLSRGYSVESNLDFDRLEALGVHELADPSTILNTYGTALANLAVWSSMDSEAAVYPGESAVLTSRTDAMLAKRCETEQQVSAFQEYVLGDLLAIRNAINSGDRELADLLPLLRRARKFSDWVRKDRPQQDLLKAYIEEVSKGSWLEKLPANIGRWLMFTGAGLAAESVGGAAAGGLAAACLGAIDTLLVDRLVQGWKPHQFVRGRLARFVKKDDSSR